MGNRQKVNPTSHLHQIQRSHLPSRCTPQQFAGTGWWPHHCPPRLASLAPVALPPFAAESLMGEGAGSGAQPWPPDLWDSMIRTGLERTEKEGLRHKPERRKGRSYGISISERKPAVLLAVGIVLFSAGFGRQRPSRPIKQASAQSCYSGAQRTTNRTNHTTAHPWDQI